MRLSKIVVGTDFSEQAGIATRHALAIARRMDAELVLTHALSIPDADRGLVETAREMKADLVVVGSRGRAGIRRLLLGSTAECVVRKAPCDVLVARAKAPKDGYQHILVPTDFTLLSDRALERAMELVNCDGTVELMHCWHVPDAPTDYWGTMGEKIRDSFQEGVVEMGQKCLEQFSRPGVTVRFSEQEDWARYSIPMKLEDCTIDLVVMGYRGRTRLDRFYLGNTAESTVRHARQSVYVVKHRVPV